MPTTDQPDSTSRYAFEPLDDITTLELAYVVARATPTTALRRGVDIPEPSWLEMPQNVRRHFRLMS